jgi:uncharacterized protein (DUF4415 family)
MIVIYGNFEWAAGAPDQRREGISMKRALRLFDRPHLRLPVVGAGGRRFIALGQVGLRLVELNFAPKNERIQLLSLALPGSDGAAGGQPRADWSRAEMVAPPPKRIVSLPLDEDVIAHFRRPGPGYQRRINAALRAAMDAARRRES